MTTPEEPNLDQFEDLICDRSIEPELNEFGYLAKRIAAHAYRYRIEDQAFVLARLALVASYHMGRDHYAMWQEMQKRHAELLTNLEYGNDTGIFH